MNARILIVEDESIEAMSFEQSLKSTGYEVIGIVATGKDAIESVARLRPDLVLMDIVLKGDMDGIEAASQIKENFSIPVVYITAHPEESTVKRAKLTTPYGYLIKPVNKIELKNTIELALYKHKMEDSLSKSESFYKAIFENTGTASVIIEDDTTISLANKEFEKLSGYSKKELEGKKDWTDFVVEEDLERMLDYHHKRRNNTKKPPITYNFKFIDRQGNIKNIHLKVDQIPNTKESIASLLDITEREKTEEALRNSEEKYRILFESDPDYTIILSLDGILLDINRAAERISGFFKEELVGKHFTKLGIFPEEELKLHKKHFKKSLMDGKVDPYEARIFDKNGQTRWVQNTSTPIKKNNKVYYILVIGSDITERKKAEEEIKSSLKEKEVLLKEIHHRVKNNLQIISSLLDLQEGYVKEHPTAVNVLKESQNRVLSMAMIHEMIYQSKDLSHINFSDYIRNMVSNLLDSYGIKSISTFIDVEEIYLNIETSVPLGLIVSELVSNSLKYAFPEPEKEDRISIELHSQDKSYKLIISDNGIGLSEKIGFHSESTLGLRLVNSLINQLDGTIELQRTHGTKYIIKFKEQEYKRRI